jgi:uncharacterized protein YndB with AHSA1/START domain
MKMAEGESLRLTRVFNAPRTLLFRAWTDAEQMQRWFCPQEHWGVEVETDPRVGGAYRIVMHDTDTQKDHIVRGTFREIQFPERLVFTWQWETNPGFPDTLVTIELRDLAGKTELTLIHESLPTPESRERHTHGWNGCLDRLAKVL